MNIEEKLKHIEESVEIYKKKLCLSNVLLSSDSEKYLNLSNEELRALSPEDILIGAITLRQCVNYIQLDINKHQTNYNWLEKYLYYIVAQDFFQVGDKFTPKEVKRDLVIQNNDVAKKLNMLMSEIKILLDAMKDIPYNINLQANTLEKYANVKKYQP
jgi:hypothetical protein